MVADAGARGMAPMHLQVGDVRATLGAPMRVKMSVIQAVVVPIMDAALVPQVVAAVKALPRLRRADRFPHAVRIRRDPTRGAAADKSADPADSERRQARLCRLSEDPAMLEDWDDAGEPGTGDRLLALLQRWQVEDVLLLVTRQDDSLSGRLLGQELYRLVVESAKLALEQHFLASMQAADAAKIELLRTPRDEPITPAPEPPRTSVCVMNSTNVPSWPQDHTPTVDGGGRKPPKKGRVNHFLHGRQTASSTKDAAPNATEPERAIPGEDNNNDSDPSSGGMEWLGITRDEWTKLRGIRVPVKELHFLFMCLVVLVDDAASKRNPPPTCTALTDDFSWATCRNVLQHSSEWSLRLRSLHGSAMTKQQATALRAVFQEPSLNAAALVRTCEASVKIHAWLQRLLDEYDDQALGLHMSPRAVTPRVPVPPPAKEVPPARASACDPAAESRLAAELNELVQAQHKRATIIDRGRLLKHPSPTRKTS